MSLEKELFELIKLLAERVTNLEKQVKLNEDTIKTLKHSLRHI